MEEFHGEETWYIGQRGLATLRRPRWKISLNDFNLRVKLIVTRQNLRSDLNWNLRWDLRSDSRLSSTIKLRLNSRLNFEIVTAKF